MTSIGLTKFKRQVRILNETVKQERDSIPDWLSLPLGQALIEQEQRVVEEAFDGIFGEDCLQLGVWGSDRQFLNYARTQRCACIAEQRESLSGDAPAMVGKLHRLPIASESIDAVFLPHTLEYSARPHALLREVHRVLRSDGYLVVLGFKPGGMWGLRRLIPGAALPPDTEQLISDRRLKDWLDLLDLRIHGSSRYFFRWPLPGNGGSSSKTWEQRGRRWWPELSACYMLTAQKRMYTMTPVKKAPWRSRPKVVGGLVKPSTRISRIRFDDNN